MDTSLFRNINILRLEENEMAHMHMFSHTVLIEKLDLFIQFFQRQ